MISNCGKNEYGGATGGVAGDQTSQEYWIISWYNFNPNVVYRHPNSKIRNKIADLAADAANNDKIGYDQTTRTSFYEMLKSYNWQPKDIPIACAADCSSATAAVILAAANILLNAEQQEAEPDTDLIAACNKILKTISAYDTTVSLNSSLPNAGFLPLNDSKYLSSDKYLLPGDVILNIVNHVAINLSTGSNAQSEAYGTVNVASSSDISTVEPITDAVKLNYMQLQYGSGLNSPLAIVKILQLFLSLHGFNCDADGEFGSDTENQVKRFQTRRNLEINGVVDELVWEELIRFEE